MEIELSILGPFRCVLILFKISIYKVIQIPALGESVFSIFFLRKTTYCCSTRCLSVRRPSVCLSFMEMILFCGKSKFNQPIDLKLGLNVVKGHECLKEVWV